MNYKEAKELADSIVTELKPYCLRIEIAGSIRRKKEEFIKDVEIVAIPDPRGLFQLRDLVNKKWGTPSIGAFPSKYTRIRSSVNIDFFFCTKETWGMCLLIRTGSADWIKRYLGYWKKKSAGGYCKDLILHRGDHTIVPTPEEEDCFTVMNLKLCPPERRI